MKPVNQEKDQHKRKKIGFTERLIISFVRLAVGNIPIASCVARAA